MTGDLELSMLEMFTGTQSYYKFHFGTLITDGVKYACDNGYYWFISDSVFPNLSNRIFSDLKVSSK